MSVEWTQVGECQNCGTPIFVRKTTIKDDRMNNESIERTFWLLVAREEATKQALEEFRRVVGLRPDLIAEATQMVFNRLLDEQTEYRDATRDMG